MWAFGQVRGNKMGEMVNIRGKKGVYSNQIIQFAQDSLNLIERLELRGKM